MTLRNRLFALVAAVVAITVALVTWAVSTTARAAFEALDEERTRALVAEFRREFAREGEEVTRRVERIAASDELRRIALDIGKSGADSASYVDAAAPLAAASGLDVLDLVAADGTIVSSAHWPARFGYRHPWVTPSRESDVTSATFLEPVELPNETSLGLIVVRKVDAGLRRLYVTGGRLDRHFLRSLQLPDGMRALLYRNLEPDVSRHRLIDASGRAADAGQLEPLIARVRQSGHEAHETVQWPDGPETLHAIPLRRRDGGVGGVLLVGSSGRELAAMVERIRLTGAALGALGMAIGFALSYVVAARVTKPVEQLADGARAIAAGDWNVRLGAAQASGEIGELATAFRTMATQLVDQRERLVQTERVAAWRELARRLAHELKNPLFPLRIAADNLRRAKPADPREFDEVFEESLTTFSIGLNNLNAVIGRFSDFAKMPAPHFEQVSPNDVVRQTLALIQPQLEAKQPPITVTVDLDSTLGPVRIDPEQLGRAVHNLLLNAIDAMPEGGALAIRTRRSGETVRLEVADTGQGLTDEERRRLFTPYYTTKQHGTGLGLAIVQSVVADHNGKIRVESRRGEGTSISIELPAPSPAERT